MDRKRSTNSDSAYCVLGFANINSFILRRDVFNAEFAILNTATEMRFDQILSGDISSNDSLFRTSGHTLNLILINKNSQIVIVSKHSRCWRKVKKHTFIFYNFFWLKIINILDDPFCWSLQERKSKYSTYQDPNTTQHSLFMVFIHLFNFFFWGGGIQIKFN